jgi:lipopolysaccharide export system permease protein
MQLHLEDGRRYQELVNDPNYKKSMPHNTMEFSQYDLNIDLSELAFNRTDKERFSEDHRMMNINQLQTRIDSLDRYIKNKKGSLYRYLEPYFYIPSDSLEIADTGVTERLAYLLAYQHNKQRKDNSDIRANNSPIGGPKMKAKKLSIATKAKTAMEDPKEKSLVLRKEEALKRALQNTNNAKRISFNNVDDTAIQNEMQTKYSVEWHRKFTLAISCILLFFIGAPLGAIIKKGGFGLPLVISLLLFIIYYVLSIFGEKLAKQGTLTGFTGMWMSTFILFPLALFLTYKASRDSQLFDRDFYKRLIPKRFKK